ncbi:DNA polymerase [Quillaja saponaria]|uniref:DNA polymerase kappa n=1 Tax=Quillaja saponaria TaxID=32244 RepID=A0AAD7M0T9_QUISA|nr:DNA polymerase [Quillaja saponaria]
MEDSGTAGDSARPWQSYHTVYTNAKAGMDGVDKEKVQRIVYEMSKGSKYFENEERKEAFIRQKIENMRAQCAKLTEADISHYQKVADKRILELEATRDLSRIWLHIDMDAFYAAVETISNLSLKGKPMAVGSMSMISTANYEARKYGVRAAMPGFIALKLCPELVFVPTDFKKYTYYSGLTRKVFQRYDPNFMAASLDEAYLDITEVCKKRSIPSEEIAEELRASVCEETGLTCSAGVAPNILLAKVCSDINKPNGQFVLPNDRTGVMAFISSLPIRKIGGIGKVTEHILKDALGINTCEEMRKKGSYLCALFSQSTADFFLSVGLGIGKTQTPQVRLRKSISNERTFSATEDEVLLYKKLEELVEMLSVDMQKEGLCGRTLTLKLKTASFEVRTRALTLQNYISSREDILKHASKLLKAELPISLRLIGLRVSQFNEDKFADPTQKTLTNFITLGDANRDSMSNLSHLQSDVMDHDFIGEAENDLTCHDYSAPFSGKHSSDLDDHNCMVRNNPGAHKKSYISMSYENPDEVHASVRHTSKPDESGVPQSLGSNMSSLQEQFEGTSLCREYNRTNPMEENALSSSCLDETLLWLDEYKCSLCGIELPPSYVEERQEHSDFHLAEKLQKEEPSIYPRTSLLTKRIQKDQIARKSKTKKQKLSQKDGRYIPIDCFFVKSNQSF